MNALNDSVDSSMWARYKTNRREFAASVRFHPLIARIANRLIEPSVTINFSGDRLRVIARSGRARASLVQSLSLIIRRHQCERWGALRRRENCGGGEFRQPVWESSYPSNVCRTRMEQSLNDPNFHRAICICSNCDAQARSGTPCK